MAIFVLAKGWQGQPYFDKAARLIQCWPQIVDQAGAVTPPAIFLVPWSAETKGRFEQVKLSRPKPGAESAQAATGRLRKTASG